MAGKTDQGVSVYCANSMQPQIEVFKKAALKITRRKNIEDIHDLRVASRRIRTCLTIFSEFFPAKKLKGWSKEFKDITKTYGSVRDLDVQIDLVDRIYSSSEDPKLRSGLRRIKLRLKQRRQKKQAETTEITQSILSSPSLIEMSSWCEAAINYDEPLAEKPLDLIQLGYKNIQSRLDEFLFFEVFIFDPLKIEELHQMRIAAKRLRYSLEIFSTLYEGKTDFALDIARQTQQYIGEIHDADVWINFLPKFLNSEQQRIAQFYGSRSPFSRIKPGVDFLISDRKSERDRLYKQFLEDWQKWKLKETWLNLRKIIFLTSVEKETPSLDVSSESPTANQPN
ncbi:MAG TPA: CHAD domain-containing protein [Pelolinea sp.]|nr:CHAD domain-containing protein [Pelolinea sp.]